MDAGTPHRCLGSSLFPPFPCLDLGCVLELSNSVIFNLATLFTRAKDYAGPWRPIAPSLCHSGPSLSSSSGD